MDRFGGWGTCQEITTAARTRKPQAIHIAEYWPVNSYVVRSSPQGGAGFDATWSDRIRDSVRGAVGQASGGANSFVDLASVANAVGDLDMGQRWRLVNCLENHDIVKFDRGDRIPRLADSSNSRSWYARSRSRWATGLLLSSPGIPMLFMGGEFLEDKRWSDDPAGGGIPSWGPLKGGDKVMNDFLRFVRELLALRRRQPALRGEGLNVFHIHSDNRVLAFQRWVEGLGRDVVVVSSLKETTYYDYRLGFPGSGRWLEVFNSDVYDNWVNPAVAGNGGAVEASGGPMHGLPASAGIVIPANSLLIFARE
jgi:1,4-alpha-glucan branching enzyme